MHIEQMGIPALPALRLPAFPILLCCLFLGAARFQLSVPPITPDHIAWYNEGTAKMVVEGNLIEPPDVRDQFTYLRVQVDQLHLVKDPTFKPVHGLLLAKVDPGGNWAYGDRVRLEGDLSTPFVNETFSFQDYLARQDIYSVMSNARGLVLLHNQGSPVLGWIYTFRDHALDHIQRFFPDPEASLLAGILLGVRTGIPYQVNEAFRLTGTSHIIAISGFNITLLAGLFYFFFRRMFSRWRGAIVTAVVIIVYTLMVGASAAVVRAAVLAVFSLFGKEVGRRQTGLNSLAIVAASMAIFKPGVLWDVGFQLSFAATLGLILYADPFLESFNLLAGKFLPEESVKRWSGVIGTYFLFTLAAQVTTLPLVLHYTGDLSLSALIANPLILPAQPPLMILGGIATLTSLLSETVGQWAAYGAWPFLTFTIRTVEWLAKIPGGILHLGSLKFASLTLYYFILFGWTTMCWVKTQKANPPGVAPLTPEADKKLNMLMHVWRSLKERPWIVMMGLVVLMVVVWREVLSAPDGALRVTLLNVGSGEAIYIRTPQGRNILINGGESGMALADALGRRLPLGQREFDWWVIANGDEESVAGLLAVINRYPPQQVLWAGATHGTYASRQLWETLTLTDIPVTLAVSGQRLEFEDGGSLEMLHVGPRGATMLLKWRNFSLLLPVGANFESLEQLEGEIQPVTVLLLADAGYAPLNPREWIMQLSPQLIWLSVAADDRQGRPDAEVIEAVEGYPLLRTDQNGWIEVRTNGDEMWVEVERR